MLRLLASLLCLLLLPVSLTATSHDPVNTIPSANASFMSDLQNFLREEDGDRFSEIFGSFVVSGGTHVTGAGLTHSPTTTIAYPGGMRVSETGSIVYPDDDTGWVIVHRADTGNVGTFTRVSGTHYLIDFASSSEPALPADSAFLMSVTTSGGAVTVVTDLRVLFVQDGVASYTFARLPTAGTAGRIARVTDDVQGLWMDTGVRWVALVEELNVKELATAGAGTGGDPYTGWEAPMNTAIGAGVTRFRFSDETYLCATAITFKTGNVFVGSNTNGTVISVTSTSLRPFVSEDVSAGVENVLFQDLRLVGPGATSTAIGLEFISVFESRLIRVDIRLFDVGWTLRKGTSTSSSFSNTAIDSKIVSNNTINIDGQELSNNLSLYHVTFGGGPVATGIQMAISDTFHVFGGDCEGVTVSCIDIDGPTSGTGGGHVISGVHFEANTSSAADIRIGDTNNVESVQITGNLFAAGAGATYPIDLQNAENVFMSGNVVQSGYTTSSVLLACLFVYFFFVLFCWRCWRC